MSEAEDEATRLLLESFRAEHMQARKAGFGKQHPAAAAVVAVPPPPPLAASSGGGGNAPPPPPAPPPAHACSGCGEPASLTLCTCTAPHHVCGACFLGSVRSQLAAGSLYCPFALAPGPGAAERGFPACIISDAGFAGLERNPALLPAGEAPLTPAEFGRYTRLTIVNAARLSGVLAHACPRASCPGVFYGDAPPPAGSVGQMEECAIGKHKGTSAAPCPAQFCAICGELWDPLHKGRACGVWREAAPPPEGIKNCPKCGVPSQHCFGHGCHHILCRCGVQYCFKCLAVPKADSPKRYGHPSACQCDMFCTPTCGCVPCTVCDPKTKALCAVMGGRG